MPATDPYAIEVLEVTQEVIECLLEGDGKPQRPGEIARKVGANRSRVFRVLKSLEGRGYVCFDKDGVWLGYKFLQIAERMRERFDIFIYAKSVLGELAQSTGDTAHLFVRMRDSAVCIANSVGRKRLQVEKIVGEHVPLNVAAAPLVLLAFLAEREQESCMRNLRMTALTENTITDREQLKRRLRQIRSHGYAVDNEEFEIGARAVSAPVFYIGDIVGAISVDTPSVRFTKSARERIIGQVVEAAERISVKSSRPTN